VPISYSPYFVSERVLGTVPGCGFTFCRGASDWNATGFATLGESAIADDGHPKSTTERKRDLQRGINGTGAPTRCSFNTSHVAGYHGAMFPDLPMPIKVVTEDFGDDLWSHLGSGPSIGDYVISIALDLSVLPGVSPLRQYTGPVGHQVVLWKRRSGAAKVLDPMRPQSGSYTGDWVSRSQIVKAAKAIEEGLVIAELYPIGQWTREAMLRRKKNGRISDLEDRVGIVQAQRDAFEAQLAEAQGEVEDAQSALATVRQDVLGEGQQALEALK